MAKKRQFIIEAIQLSGEPYTYNDIFKFELIGCTSIDDPDTRKKLKYGDPEPFYWKPIS